MTGGAALTDDSLLPWPSASAIFRELSEGGVVFSTADEVYFGVNPVGAKIWSLLPPRSRTFGGLCAELERSYPDVEPSRLRADARQFIESLVASGLAAVRGA